jgi:RNA polymerase sigma factor (sigma-70 family)
MPSRAAGFKPTASDQFRHPGVPCGCMVIAAAALPSRVQLLDGSGVSFPGPSLPSLEVSALTHAGVAGQHGRSPLLRLQSDDRLIGLIRRGNHHAFEALVARYQARLLAFCRHMLASREDAEDVLQEVFAAAFNAILADDRSINVRPWLYRIARNRCLNHLRKQQAIGVDSMDVHLSEHGITTADKVHKREDFRLLMADVQDLAETQRTALLLREIDALSYEQIAEAMETTVPSVKSLLVRARVALAEAAEARLLSCAEVREELGQVAEGLARTSAPARRHVRSCERCQIFRKSLRQTNRALAAVFPVGPLLLLKKTLLAHLGMGASALGGGAAASAGGSAAAGAAAGGALQAGAGALASKAVAGLAAAAIVTAGAVEVKQVSKHPKAPAPTGHAAAAAPAVAAAPVPVASTPQRRSHPAPAAVPAKPVRTTRTAVKRKAAATPKPAATPVPTPTPAPAPVATTTPAAAPVDQHDGDTTTLPTVAPAAGTPVPTSSTPQPAAPTPTPVPAEPTPTPTVTPEPSPTPTPTVEPTPSATPGPSVTPAP